MYFLINYNLKIIFGWSTKCGCSHIKKIFWFLENNILDNPIHNNKEKEFTLPDDIENYTTILIIRNPYERLVSGFLDKYKKESDYISLWLDPEITFSKFVDEIIKNDYKMIDFHHFTPQLTEQFDNKIIKSKEFIIYDINKINYSYIESRYNTKIPEYLLNYRGGHERIKKNENIQYNVYDLDMELYIDHNVDTKYFYNNYIKNKIYNFYKNDFLFFKEYEFDYNLDL